MDGVGRLDISSTDGAQQSALLEYVFHFPTVGFSTVRPMMFVATRRDRRGNAVMPTAGRQIRSSGPPMRTSGNRDGHVTDFESFSS